MLNTEHTASRSFGIIGLQKKSFGTDADERDAVYRAACGNVGDTRFIPVFYGREMLGFVKGFEDSHRMIFMPFRRSFEKVYAAGIPTQDALMNAMTLGRKYGAQFAKAMTTAPTALNFYDLWPVGGVPLAGTYAGTANTSIQFTDASVGALAHGGNVSTFTKHLTNISATATAGATQPTVHLYDRVVDYQNVAYNTGSAITMTQSNTPAAGRYSTGSDSGCELMVTCQTVSNTVQQFLAQYVYVNQAGTTARTFTGSNTTTNLIVSAATPTATLGARVVSPSLAVANTSTPTYRMPLLAGDTGMQSLTSITWSTVGTANTGKICFTLMKKLATIPLATLGQTSMLDLVNMIAGLERVFDGACLSLMVFFPVATGATIFGNVDVAWN